nr:SNF2 domain-containing protein CLASSY 3-like [Ipomoea batatas]
MDSDTDEMEERAKEKGKDTGTSTQSLPVDKLMTLKISVHPSLAPDNICKSGEKDLELDPSAGVKTSFVF